jgi:hypothetical protein
VARWIHPPETTLPVPVEPDPNDYCPQCNRLAFGSGLDDCCCADLVTPRPHEL